MKTHALRPDQVRRYVVIVEDGEDVVAELKRFAEQTQIDEADFTGVGALQDVVIGRPDLRGQDTAIAAEDAELLSLVGGLGRDGDDVAVEADVIVAADGQTRRGRLLQGHARSMLKLVVTEADGRT